MGEEIVESTLSQILVLVQNRKSKLMNDRVAQIRTFQDKMKRLDATNQMQIANTRDLYYRIEDVVDSMLVQLTRVMDPNKRMWAKRIFGRSSDMRKVVDTVEKLWVDFVDMRKVTMVDSQISIIMNCINFSSRGGDSIVQWPRRRYSASGGGVEHFVGRKNEFQMIKNRIVPFPQSRNQQVICILGGEGSGKSALAWKIYCNSKVRNVFKGLAWVTLTGDECQTEIVELEIQRQLGLGPKQKIKVGPHIIVVDHVNGIQQWQFIAKVKKDYAGPNTIILLTTQKVEIVPKQDLDFVHLDRMNAEEGWELLKKYAFPEEDAPAVGSFYELGKKMVVKCEYLPHAISNVGRALNSKRSLLDWHAVNENLHIYQESLSSDHSRDEQMKSIEEIYQQLPQYVKQCFLYLGGISIRSSESIDAQDLMLLWIGERIFSSSQGESMLRKAGNILRELADKNMLKVQLEEFSMNSRINLCSVEARECEFCLNQGVNEDFRLKVLDFYDGKIPDLDSPAGTLMCETRRLAIHFNGHLREDDCKKIADALDSMKEIRSVIFLNSGSTCVDLPFTYNFAKLELLRTLHLVRCKFQGRVLPKGIDKLMNLRYLGLVSDDFKEVLNSILNLRNLSVLNLQGAQTSTATQTDKALNALSELTQLKHLCLPHCSRKLKSKLKLEGLTELETLIGFNADIHDVNGLKQLKKLRHLIAHAYSTDSVRSITDFITQCEAQIETNLWIEKPCDFTLPKALTALEEALTCQDLSELTLSMVRIVKFPNCKQCFSKKLYELKLIGCEIVDDPMEALGNLPNLRKLCMGYNAFVGARMKVCREGFQNLEHLELRSLRNLETWEVEAKAMEKLSVLIMRRCPKLKEIPKILTTYMLKSMHVELSPHAPLHDKIQEYHRNFHSVPLLQIEVSEIPDSHHSSSNTVAGSSDNSHT